jgi:ABC-type transport system involved in multi-copper enzyme maturation permease subunit
VRALVRAEALKLRSTRTTPWLLLGTLAMMALTVWATISDAGSDNSPVPLDDPGLLAGTVGTGLLIPQVLVVLFGVLASTQEFRYGTATSTYLVEPRRARVLVAKWLAMAVASAVIVAGALAFSVPFGMAMIRFRDGDVTAAGQFWEMVAAGFFVMAAYAVMGVAIGAVVRHQIAAVVGVLVWMLAVEHVVLSSYTGVGRWMPVGATLGALRLGPANGLGDKLLSAPMGGLLLVGYTVVAVALALRLAPKRDIL